MEVRFLSAKYYKDPNANNGDCILIDTGSELVIYDCGCEEHAERVLHYMEERSVRIREVEGSNPFVSTKI